MNKVLKTTVKTIVCGILAGLFLFSQGEQVWAKNAKLYVDATAAAGGDGSKHSPFRRITDAVNRAREIWLADSKKKTKIEINVEPGTYVGSYSNADPNKEDLPLTLDIPGLKLEGSTSIPEDGDGLPTGDAATGENTLLIAQPALTADQILLLIAPTSSVLTGRGVEVSQISFIPQGGLGIFVNQAQDFTVLNNFVSGGGPAGIDVRASSGKIQGNYVASMGCGICIGAGNASSPANVIIRGSRSVNNQTAGLLLGGGLGENDAIHDTLSAVVEDNDFSSNNANQNQGSGIRVIVVRHDPPNPGTFGSVTAAFSGNRISNNNFGFSIDAGFPYRTFNGVPDTKLYNGTLNLSFSGNNVSGNLRSPALITFTRNTAALNPASPQNGLSRYKYLEHSTFNITDSGGDLDGYWFDHPVSDPVDGRTLQNILKINGVEIGNGSNAPFP